MPTGEERLVLEMSADLKRFEKQLDRANTVANQRLTRIERDFDKHARRIASRAGGMADDVRSAIATIALAAAIREVAQYADAWTRARNSLLAAGTAAQDVGQVQDRILDIAQETRSEYAATAGLYAKLLRSSKELGASELQVARATETVNKALATGGASGTERAAAILQLSQGLASGVLQGDELRSIRENSTVLAQAIADEFGVTIGKLKELGAEGKLTADRVFAAILKSSEAVDKAFAKTTPTIEDSFTRLQNAAIQYVGKLDAATSASEKFAGLVTLVVNNLDLLVDASVVAATVIGGALAGKAIASLVVGSISAARALGITTAAIQAMGVRAVATTALARGLAGAMALLGGPVGIAIAATAIAFGAYALAVEKSKQPSKEFSDATDVLTAALDDYEEAAMKAATATGKEAEELRKAAERKREAIIKAREHAAALLIEARAHLAVVEAANAETVRKGFDPEGYAGQAAAMGVRENKARANADAAAKAVATADRRLAQIDAEIKNLGKGTAAIAPTKPTKGGGRSGGKSKEDLAAMREELRLRAALDAAEAAGNIEEQRRLEQALDLRSRIDQYRDAGLSKEAATTQALKDQSAIVDGLGDATARRAAIMGDEIQLQAYQIAGEVELERALERKLALEDRIQQYRELGYDTVSATEIATREIARLDKARAAAFAMYLEDEKLAHELRLATLANDKERVRLLEREVAIRERARTLEESGGLSKGDARNQATVAVGEEERAAMRGLFRETFRDGVKAAMDGDLYSYLSGKVADFSADVLGRSLDVLADSLFDYLSKEFPGLFDFADDALGAEAGAATMAQAISSAGTAAGFEIAGAVTAAGTTTSTELSAVIVTAGGTAASSMGAAIVAAGQQAAAAMAAAISSASATSSTSNAISTGATSFAGARAGGGNIRKGGRYLLNDREPVVPTTHGTVFSAGAMKGLANLGRLAQEGRGMGRAAPVSVQVVNNTGVAADAQVERQGDGGMKISLEPLADQMVEGQGRSGNLRKALNRSPQPRRRG